MMPAINIKMHRKKTSSAIKGLNNQYTNKASNKERDKQISSVFLNTIFQTACRLYCWLLLPATGGFLKLDDEVIGICSYLADISYLLT